MQGTSGPRTLKQLADVDQVAGHRGRGRTRGAHEVRAAAGALPAFEVAVAGRRASLAGRQDVRVHAQAHRAPGVAPLETRGLEDRVEALVFGRTLHRR